MKNFVITIARGFGSGGRQIAAMLADELHIHSYNNRILTLASQYSGYPEHYEKGFAITMPAETAAHTYVAGAKREEDRLLTSGGRVLGVTATAADLKSAIEKAYERVESVHFDNAFYRHDIGQRALKALEH